MIFVGSASNKIKSLYLEHRRKTGYKTPPRTALDSLQSILNKEAKGHGNISFSKDDEADSDEDVADLVFRKAILPGRTGDFDTDFLPSPKVPKGVKGGFKKSSAKVSKENFSQSNSVVQCDANIRPEGKGPEININEGLLGTESDSTTCSPGRLSDLDMNGNIQPSGRMSTSAPHEVNKITGVNVDNSLPLTHPGNIKSILSFEQFLDIY